MIKRKNILLMAALLWFFNAACWTIAVGADFYYKETPGWLAALHVLTVLISLTAAAVNFARYKKEEEDI
ncbi:MAG: hypothetical protein HFI38_04495 [Lachnospiraceae bacterium]|jgi:hypothetical protein|nr:hypothetical protein [Lachnospiraceae bacterium]